MNATTALRGAARVAIYKQATRKGGVVYYWASCDCGWSSGDSEDVHKTLNIGGEHLIKCKEADR